MTFKKLTKSDKDFIIKTYRDAEINDTPRKEVQQGLASAYDVHTRTIRKWAKKLGVGVMAKNIVSPSRILIYDIETSRVPALVWWSGKQYVGGAQLQGEPKIITVAWKWLGEDKVSHLKWNKDHCDRELLEEFLKQYNKADLVIGYNNNNFDNRWVNARALKHGLKVNTYVRSLDLMKEAKRLFRLPSYALSAMCQVLDVTMKKSHEGLKMWDKIQFGTPEEQKEYLKKMVDYNIGDIVSTEEVYIKLRPYIAHQTHFGVMNGEEKFTCPNCGGKHVRLDKRTVTPAGTVQIIMECQDDNTTYKITNKQYMNFLDYKMKNNGEPS